MSVSPSASRRENGWLVEAEARRYEVGAQSVLRFIPYAFLLFGGSVPAQDFENGSANDYCYQHSSSKLEAWIKCESCPNTVEGSSGENNHYDQACERVHECKLVL